MVGTSSSHFVQLLLGVIVLLDLGLLTMAQRTWAHNHGNSFLHKVASSSPDGCVIVQDNCRTGFGDMLLDVISLVAEARVVHSCRDKLLVILQEGDATIQRWYDFPALVKSRYFELMLNTSARPLSSPPGAKHYRYRACGRHAVTVGQIASNATLRSALVLQMGRVARSLQLSVRSQPAADVRDRIAVHARRGDMLGGSRGSAAFYDMVYTHAMDFLASRRHTTVHICTDDHAFEPELLGRFRARGFNATSTVGAEPIDDMELMRRSKYIILAGTQSSFSLLAAMLGNRTLYSYQNAAAIQTALSANGQTKMQIYRSFASLGVVDMRGYP